MDWNRIKSIFIISFLILDIYLMYQYFESRNANQYEILTHTSFEELLSEERIEYVSLPKEQIHASYLSAKPKIFTDLDERSLSEKDVITYDNTTLVVNLKNPIKISKNFIPTDLNSFIKAKVINGEQYTFWEKSERENVIVYYQKYKDFQFYKNKNARLIFYLNEDDEIVSYEQTFLEGIEVISEKEEILPAIKALEMIYDEHVLKQDSKITKVELGYYSLIQPVSQVLTPTWRFVINGEENVFVNAFEGNIIRLDSDLAAINLME